MWLFGPLSVALPQNTMAWRIYFEELQCTIVFNIRESYKGLVGWIDDEPAVAPGVTLKHSHEVNLPKPLLKPLRNGKTPGPCLLAAPLLLRCAHVLTALAPLTPADGTEQLGLEQGEVEKPSGAIGASSRHLHLLTRPSDQDQRQAPAAGAYGGSSAGSRCKWGWRRQQVQAL
ncbi:hypothetical protein QTO34_018338, partial [Cnephaeus nilssonii]